MVLDCRYWLYLTHSHYGLPVRGESVSLNLRLPAYGGILPETGMLAVLDFFNGLRKSNNCFHLRFDNLGHCGCSAANLYPINCLLE
jgi:hypothetical protein